MNTYKAIQEALIKSQGKAQDDHNNGGEITLIGLAGLLTPNHRLIPVALCEGDYFSLNRVYLEGETVHLGIDSVAGVLFPVNYGDIRETIVAYNEAQVDNKFSCGKLVNVLTLKPYPVLSVDMTADEYQEALKAHGGHSEETLYQEEESEKGKEELSRSAERIDVLKNGLSGGGKIKGIPATIMADPEHAVLLEKLDNNWVAKEFPLPQGGSKEQLFSSKHFSRDEGTKPFSFPETIEDEMPPVSKAFYDKVTLQGGRLTMMGVVYDYPFTDSEEPVVGVGGFVVTPPKEALEKDNLYAYKVDLDLNTVLHFGKDKETEEFTQITCDKTGVFIKREFVK